MAHRQIAHPLPQLPTVYTVPGSALSQRCTSACRDQSAGHLARSGPTSPNQPPIGYSFPQTKHVCGIDRTQKNTAIGGPTNSACELRMENNCFANRRRPACRHWRGRRKLIADRLPRSPRIGFARKSKSLRARCLIPNHHFLIQGLDRD